VRERVCGGQRSEGREQALHEVVEERWLGTDEAAAEGLHLEVGLAMRLEKGGEGGRVPGVGEDGAEDRQGVLGRELAALEGLEALLGELVEVEAEAVQGDDAVRVVGPLALLGVGSPGGLADRLERGPAVGAWEQALEQVAAAELAGEVGAPPAEPRLLADVALAGPGDGDLARSAGGRARRSRARAGCFELRLQAWAPRVPAACASAGVHGSPGVPAVGPGFNWPASSTVMRLMRASPDPLVTSQPTGIRTRGRRRSLRTLAYPPRRPRVATPAPPADDEA
jgi:hypothetical protein